MILAVTLGIEASTVDAELNELDHYIVGPIRREPKICDGIALIIGVSADPYANVRKSVEDTCDVLELLLR